ASVGMAGNSQGSTPFQFECLAPGTYYIRVTGTECATYSLGWSIAGSPTPNTEVEPNDVFAQAQSIPLGQWAEGHVGENLFILTDDAQDRFRIDLPEDSVRVRIQYEATGLSTTMGGYIQVTAFWPWQSPAAQRFTGTGFNATTVDSLVVDCYAANTVHVSLSSLGCQAYRFRVLIEPLVPGVAFSTARFGQQVSFSPQVSGANSLFWDFGDLTTSTAQHPLKTYGFGNFNATLTATNTTCNYSASASELLVFTGLESYSPDRAGQGLVNMQVYGGSLTSATVVRITGTGGTFTGSIASVNLANSVITASFDLTDAPIGVYDVEVDIPGQGTVTVADGFTVEGLQYPECRVEVLGPSVFLVNRPQLFRLIVRNTGNVLAEGVVVGMAWPSGVVTVLGSQQLAPPSAGTTTLTVNGQTFTINNSDLAAFHAVDPVTPITQLNGEPFIGAVRSFVLPQVPAGGFVEIPFTVTGTFTGPVRIMGYAHPLNMFHLGQLAPPWQNMIECYAYESAAAIDGTDGPIDIPHEEVVRAAEIAARLARESAGQYDEQVIAAQNEVGYTQDGESATYAEDFAGMLEAASRAGAANGGPGLQQHLDNLTDTEQDQLSKDRVDAMQQIINENAEVQQQRVFPPPSPWFGDGSIGQTNLERLNELFGPEQDLQTQQELTDKTEDELDNSPVDLPIELEDGLVRRITLTLWRLVNAPLRFLSGAFDPNGIHGPVGVGSEGFLSRDDLQTFTILFENVDTATAAAQEVFVETQLDLTRFDPSTFSFGGVVIGGRHFNVPPGRQEFTFEAQMEPTDPYKVRINGTFNPATGLARWEFITLDLNTDNLPVLDGFLPPNVNSPDGEGSVLYSVRPWSTLPSNTAIASTASIVFDLNEPIITNTWSNTTDDQPPTSFVSASAMVEGITLTFTGTDDASGIAYYEVFVSTDGGPWQLLAASAQHTAQLTGAIGSTYAFYSQAVDSVGNREVKEPIAEATVTLTGIAEHAAEVLFFSTYPNPTDGVLTITAMRPIHGAQLVVHDVRGREVMQQLVMLDAGASRTIDLRALGAGTYTLSVRSASGAFGAKRVVVVR
ncbi:MAG: T9SS type A sorting domain-containing protein, partial [Flavobacteriales bacterium]